MSKTSTKMIYYFGKTKTEGKGNQKPASDHEGKPCVVCVT